MIIFIKKIKTKEGLNFFDIEKIKKGIPAGYTASSQAPTMTLTANHVLLSLACEKVVKQAHEPKPKNAVKAAPKSKPKKAAKAAPESKPKKAAPKSKPAKAAKPAPESKPEEVAAIADEQES